MHEALHDSLQPVLVRWTMGGAAAQCAPDGLREKLGEDPEEAELRLLAIAGQALGMLVVPEPAGELEGLADLPALSLPTMPDHLRPFAARALTRTDEWLRNGLLGLIADRGYVVHPSDWMPSRTGTVPGIYAPWQDWLAGLGGEAIPSAGDLDARWDNHGPAGRRMLLAAMRERDPQAALDVVARRSAGQPAEQRLWMVEALSKGLSDRDLAFLGTLSADRAPSVRAAATRLLKRLGAATIDGTADEAARDVVDFLKIETTGLLRKRRVIVSVPIRNQPQALRRTQALAALDAATLATALGVEDVDLPGMVQWGQDPQLDQQMAALILGTGSDAVVAEFERVVAEGAPVSIHAIADGLERLSQGTLSALAERAVAETRHLPAVVDALRVRGVVADPSRSPAWRDLLLRISREGAADVRDGRDEMAAMGILLTAEAARSAVDRLTALGVTPADPRMDALRINAGL